MKKKKEGRKGIVKIGERKKGEKAGGKGRKKVSDKASHRIFFFFC